MAFDAHKNLALATVAVAPSPATSGTSLIITAGFVSLFPAVPFNCTVYPPGVAPTFANAEIVRVTNIAGDIFTITRAQEGTTAKSIASGWSIANTITAKVITDIEATLGGGIQSISAGTSVATGPQLVFSNSNNISFGISNSVLTAAFAGGGGGAAISGGANSQSTGTVVFSNSNGISFGLSNNGVMTVSHNAITSQSVQTQSNVQGISAGTQVGRTGDIVFSNANGVTFGMSNSSVITASIGAGAAPGSISAGAASVALGQVVFSDSNGISFGLNGSTVTAQHNALTSQSNQAASASNGSFAFQTLAFSNANNVTFGTSAGGIITASVATAAAGNSVNFSAGTQSANLGSIVFSNSNGVSFGLSNGSITASVAATIGGASMVSFEPYPAVSTAGAAWVGTGELQFASFALPLAMNVGYARILVSMASIASNIATIASASATAEGGVTASYHALIYSKGTGASSNSLQLVTSNSVGYTWLNSISITNSSQASYTQAVTYPIAGSTAVSSTQYSVSASVYSFSTNAFPGLSAQKYLDVPIAGLLTAGNYWLGFRVSQSSSSAGALTAITRAYMAAQSQIYCLQPDYRALIFNDSNNVSAQFGAGTFTAAATTASLNLSQISGAASNRRIYFQLIE